MNHLDIGRYEQKYVIPAASRDHVLAVAGAYVVPDPHGRPLPTTGSGYVVHSTYFDAPDLGAYHARTDAARVRRRVRVRTYGSPGDRAPVFLELKRKLDEQVIKSRAKVGDADTWAALGERPWAWWAAHATGRTRAVAERFTYVVDTFGLVPLTSVHYEREVYIDPRPDYPKVRLTLDRHVTASVRPSVSDLYPAPTLSLVPDDQLVLELKFDGAQPAWMRAIVRELGLAAEPVSKFGLSIARAFRADHVQEQNLITPWTVRRAAETTPPVDTAPPAQRTA